MVFIVHGCYTEYTVFIIDVLYKKYQYQLHVLQNNITATLLLTCHHIASIITV